MITTSNLNPFRNSGLKTHLGFPAFDPQSQQEKWARGFNYLTKDTNSLLTQKGLQDIMTAQMQDFFALSPDEHSNFRSWEIYEHTFKTWTDVPELGEINETVLERGPFTSTYATAENLFELLVRLAGLPKETKELNKEQFINVLDKWKKVQSISTL